MRFDGISRKYLKHARGRSDKMYPLRNLSWYEKSDKATLEIFGRMFLLVI